MARKGNISLESIINLYNKGFNTSEIADPRPPIIL